MHLSRRKLQLFHPSRQCQIYHDEWTEQGSVCTVYLTVVIQTDTKRILVYSINELD